MPFILTNPWGLLALSAIPVILAIHFLQRRAQVLVVSTLFLLPEPKRKSERGFRLERLINSLPLWMQLLLALLLTLLLTQPRLVDENATLRIAVVLDSSASMSVFRSEVEETLLDELPQLQGSTPNVELWVLDADLSRDRIYHGNQISGLSSSLDHWHPRTGALSPEPALRVARSLAGEKGAVIYVTDTAVESIPYGAQVYSVGRSVPNVGFTGVTYAPTSDGHQWEASVKNYSDQPIEKSWTVHYGNNTVSGAISLTLAPQELRVIRGVLPADVPRAEVRLDADDFPFDDCLPLLVPVPKQLYVTASDSLDSRFFSQFLESFDHLSLPPTGIEADFMVHAQSADAEITLRRTGIVLLQSDALEAPALHAYRMVATDHPLTSELYWQGLLVPKEARFTPAPEDQVLLWAGEEPLLFTRQLKTADGIDRQLVVNFTLAHSNALQQEAFVLLLFRFLDAVRDSKQAPVFTNTEPGQSLRDLRVRMDGTTILREKIDVIGEVVESTELPLNATPQSPNEVGFFRLRSQENLLLSAANLFADTREANFLDCVTSVLPASIPPQAEQAASENTLLWRLLLILGLIALLVSWITPRRLRL